MDVLGMVWQALGNAVNGVLQVLADFINLIISVVPNPDPFPALVDSLDVSHDEWVGYVGYWIDQAMGVQFFVGAMGAWVALMVASALFAVIYWVIKSIKP